MLLLVLPGSIACAEANGPPRPMSAGASPAQAAITGYQQRYGVAPRAQPCPRSKAGEVVVCGESPDRLPLRDERGAPDLRIATGEAPHMGVGGSPVHTPPAFGITLTMKPGRTTLRGNGAK